jgi:hypothetical protein
MEAKIIIMSRSFLWKNTGASSLVLGGQLWRKEISERQ